MIVKLNLSENATKAQIKAELVKHKERKAQGIQTDMNNFAKGIKTETLRVVVDDNDEIIGYIYEVPTLSP